MQSPVDFSIAQAHLQRVHPTNPAIVPVDEEESTVHCTCGIIIGEYMRALATLCPHVLTCLPQVQCAPTDRPSTSKALAR